MEYSLKILISKTDFENLTLRQQWLNKQFNYKSKSLFKYKSLYDQLNEFDQIVESLKQNKNININIRNSFTSLRDKLVEEIYSHQPCQDYDTCYPIILSHFTRLADDIDQGNPINLKQVLDSVQELQNDIVEREPVSKCILSVVFGVVFGLVIGAAVFTLGIFAPFSSVFICGVLTGLGSFGATAIAALAGTGFIDCISKNRYQMFYQQKEKDANGVKTEIENVFNSMKDECDVHLDSLASKVEILCNC